MPPVQSKILKPSTSTSFFAPRSRRKLEALDYATIQRNKVNPQNPPRRPLTPSSSTTTTNTPNNEPSLDGDTIKVEFPPGYIEYDSDDDFDKTDPPDLLYITMTEAEKIEAIRKWTSYKLKHIKKKRDKSSHVY
jgi:hypothetical protein